MSDLSQTLVLSLHNPSKGAGDPIIGVKSGHSAASPVTLDVLLIPRPASTVIFPVRDPAAVQYELKPGDLLIVDRATNPADGQLVILSTNNTLQISRHNSQEAKTSSNLSGAPEIERKSLPIWGAVTYIIRKQ